MHNSKMYDDFRARIVAVGEKSHLKGLSEKLNGVCADPRPVEVFLCDH